MGVRFELTVRQRRTVVFGTTALVHYATPPDQAPPAGVEPTLRDPQSRGLSISLRGHMRILTEKEVILYFPGENVFAKLLTIYQKCSFSVFLQKAKTVLLPS